MPTRWLNKDSLEQVVEAALAVGVQKRREDLLADLPFELVNQLDSNGTDEDQLRADLERLNHEPARQGRLPLDRWLQGAANHSMELPEPRSLFARLGDEISIVEDRQHRVEQSAAAKLEHSLRTVAPAPIVTEEATSLSHPGAEEHGLRESEGSSGAGGVETDVAFEEVGAAESGSDEVEQSPTPAGRSVRGLPPHMLVPEPDTIRERGIHTNDLLPIGFLQQADRFAEAVCRLRITRHEEGVQIRSITGMVRRYWGTGWLIGKRHIMTNHHVINGRDDGEGQASAEDLKKQSLTAEVLFDYDGPEQEGVPVKVDRLCHANPELDYAILELDWPSEFDRGVAELWSKVVEVPKKQVFPLNIIQHPTGAPKQIGFRNNLAAQATDINLAYFTDTKGGSSGSPVCNDRWQVVALHKAATRIFGAFEFQGRETAWVNLGTRIDRIIEDLRDSQEELWRQIGARLS